MRTPWNRLNAALLMSALVAGTAIVALSQAEATTILVTNNDGPGEGFNDSTPVPPVGGNSGTTRGTQRLIAFQRAADIWSGLIVSSVTIQVSATFDPLPCNATGAVLGSAGPVGVWRDFAGAPRSSTWYPVALANALHGSDLDPAADITATFNSALGTTCPFPGGWYYGLDGNPPSGQIDFVTVLLHELGHGLGFLTFVDLSSGARLLGLNDTFMVNLERHGVVPPDYPSMTNAQRVAASVDTGNLHWVGAHVRAASGVLTGGRVGDHVRMYAPNPQQSGSSVSHWDTALTPSQLLEPIYTGPIQNPGLELPLFADIGWTVGAPAPPPPPPPTTLVPGFPADYFGDGKTDIAIFRPSTAVWYILNPATSAVVTQQWGVAGDVPAPGDYDGDNKDDISVYRPSNGVWYINQSSNGSLRSVQWGWPTDVPVPSDYDGDGKTDVAVYRPSTGVWYIINSSTGGARAVQWGWSTDLPVPGDYDGDHKADIAVYRPSTGVWYIVNSSTGGARVVQWGWSTDTPVPGDYDGDGKTDIAVFRPSTGVWYIVNSSTGGARAVQWGWSTDIPVPGDYDGDGKTDIAVFRPSTGVWYIINSSNGAVRAIQWGWPTDIPIPGD